MLIAILWASLGINAAAGQLLSDKELAAYLENEVLSAYGHCNELTITVAAEIGSPFAEVNGLSASDEDIAVEAALECNEEWLEVVEQFASKEGYAKALVIGDRIRDEVVERNLAVLKAPKR